ncbi:hypothetical protein HDV00_009285 [Rhizophlyctis rosea]|nr:hypothetical protein HDV00_009285 [Rhizophlyctis rosea]
MVGTFSSVDAQNQRKDCLLVFVHGFLGSEASFAAFPQHVVETLSDLHHIPETSVEALVFPRYDTRGNSSRAAQKLIDWLLLYATTAKYRCVILLAHSMGGLLAVDAYQYLYELHKANLNDSSTSDSKGKEPVAQAASNTWMTSFYGGTEAATSWLNNLAAPVGQWFQRTDAGASSSVASAKQSAEGTQTQPDPNPPPSDTATDNTTSPTSNLPHAPDIPDAAIPPNPSVTPGDPTQTACLNDQEFERVEQQNDKVESDIRLLVNVRGIITFDSPFYGLHTNVITQAGTSKAVSVVSEGLSNVTAYLPSAVDAAHHAAAAYLPEFISVPTGGSGMKVELPTSWLLRGVRNVGGSVRTTTVESAPVESAQEKASGEKLQDSSQSRKTMKDLTAALDENATNSGTGDVISADPETITTNGITQPEIVLSGAASDPSSTAVTVPTTQSTVAMSTLLDPNKWPTWARYTATGAAVAAGAYAIGAYAPVAAALIPATTMARTVAIQHVDILRDHMEFLYPLINSHEEMNRRIQTMQREMETRRRLMFKGFYLALPPYPVGKPAAPSSNKSKDPSPTASTSQSTLSTDPSSSSSQFPTTSDVDLDAFLPDDATALLDSKPPPRHFCVPPPSSTQHLFTTVTSPLMNEIDAHMNMFDCNVGGKAYLDLVHRTADIVAGLLAEEVVRSGG